MKRIQKLMSGLLAVGLCVATVFAQVSLVDPNIPHYKKVSGISGTLSSVGSDTLANLMTLWAEGFKQFYPNVKIEVEGKGSGTAPPALIAGTAQLGPMSRRMKHSEKQSFREKFGYEPTRIITSLDTLAIFVNKDNPIECLTIPQIDAIFSATLRCDHPGRIKRWGDLGLHGPWQSAPIRLYGRNAASGTYGFFKEHALCKGDFANEVKELPGSATVVNSVATDRFGIGYSGIGYRTPNVKAVKLAIRDGSPCYEADFENALSGKYPLARTLQIYINKPPNRPLSPLVREFLRFVLSYEGQVVNVKAGYYPLPASVIKKELKKLD